jgi:16S rRNA (adenine1518-N6/adenine1519-N6)-dimethyltransferase
MESLPALLRRFDLQPSKSLGQHFLTDDAVLERIVAAAEVNRSDIVLEIGAGLGHLTAHLAEAAREVVAVEVDDRLAAPFRETVAGHANVRLVIGDILELDPAMLLGGQPYKVVANLPYAITSAVLRHLLEASVPPQRMVVTVQREVAERIVARGGRMSLLAVSVQFYGQPRLLFRLKPGLFFPPPEVESAVIRIDRHPSLPVEVSDASKFFRVVRAGFSQPRKQLRNSLAAGLGLEPEAVVAALERAGIEPRQRAERLTLADWSRLASVLT